MTKFLLRFLFVLIFIALIVSVIAFARGYRFDFKDGTISPTGILAISSTPKAAKVYVNGTLRGVTDLNLTLGPGTYTVEIKKDGYSSFTKTVRLKGELVQAIDPILFPINPSLTPLSNIGVVKAVQIDQSDKVLLFSQKVASPSAENKDGVYLFDSGSNPLSFFPSLKTLILREKFPPEVDFKNTQIYFSYDFKQVILEFVLPQPTIFPKQPPQTVSYLISLDQENQEPFDVTISKDALLAAWQKEKVAEKLKILETFPKNIRKIATDSFSIIAFSPDKTKILYQANKRIDLPLIIKPALIAANQTQEERNLQNNSLYVYDSKEDKNYKISDASFDQNSIQWYSDSKRLVFNEKKQISITLYDGQNKQAVYSGPFEEDFFAINSSGKILVLANLNPQTNPLPDLYSVGIR